MTSKNFLPAGGSVTQFGSGQQINVFGSASGGASSRICGSKTVITADGKMETYTSMDVTGNATSQTVSDLEARVTIDGKLTVVPAPAGTLLVQNGVLYRNGVLYSK